MRVKICGITNSEDLHNACDAGADALGFVFYSPSPRAVDVEQAKALLTQLPPFVQSVGLFVNADAGFVHHVISALHLQLLQFHGDEDEAYCQQFNRPYIKAIAVKDVDAEQNLTRVMDAYPSAQGFLLDTYKAGVPGGTGESFDWHLFPTYDKPLILAGGLMSDNVGHAIKQVQPFAVDVSGGVEESPAKKSKDKMHAFIQRAKSQCITSSVK